MYREIGASIASDSIFQLARGGRVLSPKPAKASQSRSLSSTGKRHLGPLHRRRHQGGSVPHSTRLASRRLWRLVPQVLRARHLATPATVFRGCPGGWQRGWLLLLAHSVVAKRPVAAAAAAVPVRRRPLEAGKSSHALRQGRGMAAAPPKAEVTARERALLTGRRGGAERWRGRRTVPLIGT